MHKILAFTTLLTLSGINSFACENDQDLAEVHKQLKGIGYDLRIDKNGEEQDRLGAVRSSDWRFGQSNLVNQAAPTSGMNFRRSHQKINPETNKDTQLIQLALFSDSLRY